MILVIGFHNRVALSGMGFTESLGMLWLYTKYIHLISGMRALICLYIVLGML